jgi:kynurenine formamidase
MTRAIVAVFCVLAASPRAGAQVVDLSKSRLIDLTHALGPSTLAWPGTGNAVRLDTIRADSSGAMFRLALPEHFGTHLDAPRHASGRGDSNERLPLERLVAPGVVIDVSDRTSVNRDYALTVADIERHEVRHARIPPGAFVLLRTGWAERWGDAAAYFGRDGAGTLHFPSFGEDAARFLITQRRVTAVGVDAASTDIGAAPSFGVHRILGAANVPAVENLSSLSALPASGFLVMALPIKTVGGSGGPVRVVAIVPIAR